MNGTGKEDIEGLEKTKQKRGEEGFENRVYERTLKEIAMRTLRKMSIPERGDDKLRGPRAESSLGLKAGLYRTLFTGDG